MQGCSGPNQFVSACYRGLNNSRQLQESKSRGARGPVGRSACKGLHHEVHRHAAHHRVQALGSTHVHPAWYARQAQPHEVPKVRLCACVSVRHTCGSRPGTSMCNPMRARTLARRRTAQSGAALRSAQGHVSTKTRGAVSPGAAARLSSVSQDLVAAAALPCQAARRCLRCSFSEGDRPGSTIFSIRLSRISALWGAPVAFDLRQWPACQASRRGYGWYSVHMS